MGFGVDDLVAVLGFTPTDEQLAVITADLNHPLLVVAGAGSGKTTVMTARVIWAVAHGFVTPAQVLGLTFTTKAAAELWQRVRTRLARLEELDRTPRVGPGCAKWEQDPLSLTYHSFAHRVVCEHGLRIGIEPEARLLTEAEVALLAHQVVVRSRLNLALVNPRPAEVASRLMELDSQLSEHLVTPEQMEGDDLATISQIADAGKVQQVVARTRETARARTELSRLVAEFRAEKRRVGVLDFADLLRHCSELAEQQPAVGEYLRQQHRLVLLDEYQDTSHVQTRILARLFGSGHPVTAVGDPVQGIFGWRGASAESISAFPRDFASGDGLRVATLTLTVSHRSVPAILAGANRVAEPVRTRHPASVVLRAGSAQLPHPARGPAPRCHPVRVALFQTHADELQWMTAEIAGEVAAGVKPGDIAVLCRTGTDARQVGAELQRSGVPVQVATAEGLLAQPEVVEVLSVLRSLADPTDNRAVVRLLRGPRWRIGLRDLAILGRRAVDLAADSTRNPDVNDPGDNCQGYLAVAAAALRTDPTDLPSLAEAVTDPGPAYRYRYSSQARDRLRQFANELDVLRAKVQLPLTELVVQVVGAIGLDVELVLRSLRDPIGGPLASQVIDQLIDLTARFRIINGGGGLPAFLTWLATVERLGSRIDVAAAPRSHAVQVLTVHRAKGLEWESAYVPFLSEGVFPSKKASPTWLTDCSQLPNRLRGDRLALPGLADHSPTAYEHFKADGASLREYEERQLAYVALTRARSRLVATAHWWGPSQKRSRGPSQFLLDLHRDLPGDAIRNWQPPPADSAANPALTALVGAQTDAEPANEAVVDLRNAELMGDGCQLDDQERALVAEWDAHLAACLLGSGGESGSEPSPVSGPDAEWTTSTALSLVRDPSRHAIELRRPMPARPSSAARDGVAFHAWIEDYYGQGTIFDAGEMDEPLAVALVGTRSRDFERLRRGFLSLEYADRVPTATEVPFTVIIGGRVISGRIDAVFATANGWEVVDWKTGAVGAADPMQLAIYRLAWARVIDTELGNVTGAFAYVGFGRVVRFAELPDADALARRLGEAAAESGAAQVEAQPVGVGR